MKALLLCAGVSARLRPFTDRWPKCLMPIGGVPLLDHWFGALARAGVQEILVNTHHHHHIVEDYISLVSPRRQIQTVHEPVLLDTAGTLLANRGWIGHDPLLLIHADNFTDLDLFALIKAHSERSSESAITMTTFRTENPKQCGIVELDNRGLVCAFHEKVHDPPGTMANGAIYCFEPDVVNWVAAHQPPPRNVSNDVLPHWLGHMGTYFHNGFLIDIGTPEAWITATQIGKSTAHTRITRDRVNVWKPFAQRHHLAQHLLACLNKWTPRGDDFNSAFVRSSPLDHVPRAPARWRLENGKLHGALKESDSIVLEVWPD